MRPRNCCQRSCTRSKYYVIFWLKGFPTSRRNNFRQWGQRKLPFSPQSIAVQGQVFWDGKRESGSLRIVFLFFKCWLLEQIMEKTFTIISSLFWFTGDKLIHSKRSLTEVTYHSDSPAVPTMKTPWRETNWLPSDHNLLNIQLSPKNGHGWLHLGFWESSKSFASLIFIAK